MFTSVTKIEERGAIQALHESDPERLGICYVDDESGGATKHFLRNGIPHDKLFPINFDSRECKTLYNTTNVYTTCAYIQDHIKNVFESNVNGPRRYSVIWLDLMSRSIDEAMETTR